MKNRLIKKPILIIVGPTAIGKTEISLELAHKHNIEIVSVDSMQVYRYMDIGTAKASAEERDEVVHHLIDIVDPNEDYDASLFVRDALNAISTIHAKGKLPLVTGGTGLYLRALLEGIFPGVPGNEQIRQDLRLRLERDGAEKLHEELLSVDIISASRIHPNDTHRLVRALEIYYATDKPWSEHIQLHKAQEKQVKFENSLSICLTTDRKVLYDRINIRSALMVERGLEEEVKHLFEMGYGSNLKSFGAIGYRHMVQYLKKNWDYDEMLKLLARDTRRYAKRQYTWFSRTPDIQWMEVNDKKKILEEVAKWLDGM